MPKLRLFHVPLIADPPEVRGRAFSGYADLLVSLPSWRHYPARSGDDSEVRVSLNEQRSKPFALSLE
jgi:hypothetical protein